MWRRLSKYIKETETKLSLSDRIGYEAQYRTKYKIAAKYKPRSIIEIGVRAGYSAFAFLAACPNAFYYGIDNNSNEHGGEEDLYLKALDLLKEYRTIIQIKDSQNINSLPPCDFLHVDGDHSYKGCLHDIEIGTRSSKVIVVDDYDYIEEVRNACDNFKKNNSSYNYSFISDGGFRGNFIIEVGIK